MNMPTADPKPSNGVLTSQVRSSEREGGAPVANIEIQLAEVDGFEWNDELDQTLRSLAKTGLPPSPSPPWSTIIKAILFSLKVIVQNYIKLGDATMFDTREEPAGGWLWTAQDVQGGIERVRLALMDFSDERQFEQSASSPASAGDNGNGNGNGNGAGERAELAQHPGQPPPEQLAGIRAAPFTIQRLAELVYQEPISPSSARPAVHRHYSTLPKYLRAIQRVLSVSSPVASFSVNTFGLPHPAETLDVGELVTNGPASAVNGDSELTTALGASIHPTRLRRASTPALVAPTLSPIPWLIHCSDAGSLSPEATSEGRRSRQSSPLLLGGVDERPITPPLTSHLLTPPAIQDRRKACSPPGRVDELDPGRGTAEELTHGPVAIGSTALSERPTELAERLSSPPIANSPRSPSRSTETDQPMAVDVTENPIGSPVDLQETGDVKINDET